MTERGGQGLRRVSFALTGSVVAGLLAAPASAAPDALVRFVHAVPGGPGAKLSAGTGGGLAPIGVERFGGATPYRDVPTGTYSWTLNAAKGGKLLAKGDGVAITRGSWTLVAMATGMDPSKLDVKMVRYRDRGPQDGDALLRVIHASAELGKPNLQLDGRTVAKAVPFTVATPYLKLKPGVHQLSAVKPDGEPVIERKVRVRSGEAVTAITMGAKGMPASFVTVRDRTPKSSKGTGTLTVTVRGGDSLWAIAARKLGSGASTKEIAAYVNRLWARNAHHIASGSPDLLAAGDELVLP